MGIERRCKVCGTWEVVHQDSAIARERRIVIGHEFVPLQEPRAMPSNGSSRMKITESLVEQIRERAALGIRKYGVSLDRSDLSVMDWLQHLQEEMLDGAGYIETLKRRLWNQSIKLKTEDFKDAASYERYVAELSGLRVDRDRLLEILRGREDSDHEVKRLTGFVKSLANNALADDPVWSARFILMQWDYASNENAPEWFKRAAEDIEKMEAEKGQPDRSERTEQDG